MTSRNVKRSNEERNMETNFVRLGDYFINLERLLWARITHDETHPHHRTLSLSFGPGDSPRHLTFEGQEADVFISFFEMHGHDLNPPAFKPSP